MIEMRVVGEGRVGPVAMCDHCGRRIDDSGLAMVRFRHIHREPVGTASGYLIVHKGDCDRATEARDLRDWMELDDFLIRTVANSVPPDDRDESSLEQHVIGLVSRLGRSLWL